MDLRSIRVHADHDGLRLDRFVVAECPDLSRSRASDLIKQGQVSASGRTIVEPNYRVKPGEEFEVVIPDPVAADPVGEDIALNILYEDDDLVVIDKPAGLVVHPGAGNWTGTLVNALIAHCGNSLSGIGGVRRPGIVHRLDKDTSGVMVVAKNDRAHQALAEQFADHGREGSLMREYRALVWGVPLPRIGRIETLIGRHSTSRLKMAVRRENGKVALTEYETLSVLSEKKPKSKPVMSLLRCTLGTGRTHQIRVHMAHISHPIVGDELYGSGFRSKTATLQKDAENVILGVKRQALHAAALGFTHPTSEHYMEFRSDLPPEIVNLMAVFKHG
jgi:23S rRNA pseudouridine1911/1915/1917 synthase